MCEKTMSMRHTHTSVGYGMIAPTNHRIGKGKIFHFKSRSVVDRDQVVFFLLSEKRKNRGVLFSCACVLKEKKFVLIYFHHDGDGDGDGVRT